jgi:MoxR-like ATPase
MNDVTNVKKFADEVRSNIEKVFFGKSDVSDLTLTAFLSGGHALLEDVPGTGTTILARAFAATLGLSFARIQATPDLLPADILGVSVWRQDKGFFVYQRGPIVNQFVLVDEINRATPRTQSALLEAMAERQISVDGRRRPLPEPFFLIATENPVEFEGTFPLPEAQKDRFLLSISVGYPDAASEEHMLETQRRLTHPVEDLGAIYTDSNTTDSKTTDSNTVSNKLQALKESVASVHVDAQVREYLMSLVHATREDNACRLGVSPRGSLALYRAAQAFAAIHGRSFVTPEDIKLLAPPVFRQRLILSADSRVRGVTAERVIEGILDRVPVPEYAGRK